MLIFALLWLAAGVVTGLVLGYVWDNYSFSIRINRRDPVVEPLLPRTPSPPSSGSAQPSLVVTDASQQSRKPVFSDTDPHSAASELRDREIEESALLVPIVPPEDRDSSGPSSPARPPLLKASSFSDLPTYKQGIIEIRFPKVKNPKRWFVLKAGWLGYYRDETGAHKHQLMGAIRLNHCYIRRIDRNTFELTHRDNVSFHIPASTPPPETEKEKSLFGNLIDKAASAVSTDTDFSITTSCILRAKEVEWADLLEQASAHEVACLPDVAETFIDENEDDSDGEEQGSGLRPPPSSNPSAGRSPSRRLSSNGLSSLGVPRARSATQSSASDWTLVNDSREVIAAVKKRFTELVPGANVEYDDVTIFKFLKVRNFDLDKTAHHLVTYAAWRRDYGLDRLDSMGPIASLVARKIAYFIGRNRRNEPCVLLTPARHHSDDASVEHVVRLAVCLLELACREMKPPVDRFCILCDYQGFGISNMNYPAVRESIFVAGSFFPERLGAAYIVNGTLLARTVWRVVRRWVAPDTKERVYFVDRNEELLNYFTKEQLPAYLGGENRFEPAAGSVGLETLRTQ